MPTMRKSHDLWGLWSIQIQIKTQGFSERARRKTEKKPNHNQTKNPHQTKKPNLQSNIKPQDQAAEKKTKQNKKELK